MTTDLTWPTLAQCFARAGTTTRDAKDLVRALLSAAAAWPIEIEPAPTALLDDLRYALERDDLGDQLTIHIARAFARVNPNQKD